LVSNPWQYQSWILITDPNFAATAAPVLDLYAQVWDGDPLSANDYVISADEKTSIQARCRCHPSTPAGTSPMMRVSHDYHRGGAPVTQVMTQEPYASADRVFWVVDNGSSHRGQQAIDRLTEQFPNATMVHTPIHASWLNQVEVYFSIIQRKALSPNDFTDLDAIEQRLTRFETRYNAAAKPFKWKLTTTDLADLLHRLDRHQQAQTLNGAQPKAA